MKNIPKNTTGDSNRDSEIKKRSNQPQYEDKPWQTPKYGKKDEDKEEDEEIKEQQRGKSV